MMKKQFGTPVPSLSHSEIRSTDLVGDKAVPGLNWKISDKTRGEINDIEQCRRDGVVLMLQHPELFLLGSLSRA